MWPRSQEELRHRPSRPLRPVASYALWSDIMAEHHASSGNPWGLAFVEVAVITATLAILAALMPQLMGIRAAAKSATCHANIATLNSVAARYLATRGEIPPGLDALVPDFTLAIPACPFGRPYSFDGYSISNAEGHRH